jgi:hypothetical protein
VGMNTSLAAANRLPTRSASADLRLSFLMPFDVSSILRTGWSLARGGPLERRYLGR